MADSPQQKMERTVESLKQVYAVAMALALTAAIEHLLLRDGSRELADFSGMVPRLPAFIALFFTLVVFTHGMSRHLDAAYLEDDAGREKGGALLLDFFVFFLQSCFLFAAATAIARDLYTFILLATLLASDVVWAIAAHFIHYRRKGSSILRWAAVNFFALAVGLLIFLSNMFDAGVMPVALCVVAVVRTVMDYWLGWQFYFPK